MTKGELLEIIQEAEKDRDKLIAQAACYETIIKELYINLETL